MKETATSRFPLLMRRARQALASRVLLAPAAVAAVCFSLASQQAQAVVHFNGHDPIYTSAPANALPWDNVGRFCSITGGSNAGSVVSIKGKYCLTANHVELRDYVTFDGITLYERDKNFTPVQFGTSDMKLIKLVEDPGLPELLLNALDHADSNISPLYMVGWGVGNLPSQSAPEVIGSFLNVWHWGDSSTVAKRWGTNRVNRVFTYSSGNYNYSAMTVQMNSSPPDASEAALATYDSGSAAFITYGGNWYLSGIATLSSSVAAPQSSNFGTTTANRDIAQWVRIVSHRNAILDALPDTSTFEGWAMDNGLSGADALPEADPDNDGVPNLAEFAFGTHPAISTTGQVPGLVVDETTGAIAMRYRLNNEATGITVQVMHSDDMMNWSPAPGTAVIVDDASEAYTVYELSVSPSNDSYRFYTVNVTQD